MELFGTNAFRATEQALYAVKQQQNVIAQNLSNADTPGYKCKYLYFEGILKDKIASREGDKYRKELHIGTALYTDTVTNDQPDGNNVDNDTQQALFLKNSLYYETLIKEMNADFSLIRTSIRMN